MWHNLFFLCVGKKKCALIVLNWKKNYKFVVIKEK